jgi:hypothetical protein
MRQFKKWSFFIILMGDYLNFIKKFGLISTPSIHKHKIKIMIILIIILDGI